MQVSLAGIEYSPFNRRQVDLQRTDELLNRFVKGDSIELDDLPGALRFRRSYAAFVCGAAKALFVRTCQRFDL